MEFFGFALLPAFLRPEPSHPECEVSVVIPARDEENFILRPLQALAQQLDLKGLPLNPNCFEVIVLANNCQDGTAEVVRSFASRHPGLKLYLVEIEFPPDEAHIGSARRLLMDEAYRRLANREGTPGIIATTDADTRVAPDWITATRKEIARGADAVGGRILVDSKELEDWNEKIRPLLLRDTGYRIKAAEMEALLDPNPYDPWPRHHQNYGASLALTTTIYHRVKGLPVIPALEDEALYAALFGLDARFRHSPEVRVTTSGRNSNRIKFGLSHRLKEWDFLSSEGGIYKVQQVVSLEERFSEQNLLRQVWRHCREAAFPPKTGIGTAAKRLQIEPEWLEARLKTKPPFGLLYAEMSQLQREQGRAWDQRRPLEEIQQVNRALALRLSQLRMGRVARPPGISQQALLTEINNQDESSNDPFS